MTAHIAEYPEGEKRMGNARRRAVRVLAALGLVSFSFMFLIVAVDASGMSTLEVVGSPSDPPPSVEALRGAAAPLEGVHVAGALAAVTMAAVGLLALMMGPERSGSAHHVLAAVFGLFIVLPVVGNPDNVGGQAGFFDPAIAMLAVPSLVAALVAVPWRRRRSVLVRPLLVAIVTGIPLVVYAANQAVIQRNTFPPTADPHHQAHWLAMSVFGAVAVSVVAAASLGAEGWRWASGSAAVAVTAVSTVSLVQRDAASSFGLAGAAMGVAWAAGVAAVSARGWRQKSV